VTAGIPGTGIGGIFYLAGALWLPFRTLIRQMRGAPVKWAPVLQQAALALAILASVWLSGAMLGILVGPWLHQSHSTAAAVAAAPRGNLVQIASLLVGLGTLCAALTAVQVARLVVCRSEPKSRSR